MGISPRCSWKTAKNFALVMFINLVIVAASSIMIVAAIVDSFSDLDIQARMSLLYSGVFFLVLSGLIWFAGLILALVNKCWGMALLKLIIPF